MIKNLVGVLLVVEMACLAIYTLLNCLIGDIDFSKSTRDKLVKLKIISLCSFLFLFILTLILSKFI